MFYFIKEKIKISENDLKEWLKNPDLNNLKKFNSDFDIEEVVKQSNYYIFKNVMYFAIENNNIDLIKKLINQGYFIKVKDNYNKECINFRNIPSGFVSQVGLFYNQEIFNYFLEDKNKITIWNALKLAWNTNYEFYGKIKSLYNIYKKNNVKINIHDTEIIHRIIEKEDLQTLMNIDVKYLKESKCIYYYLTNVKSEDIINYIFSLNLDGDKFYNHLALSSLINNTERFKKFYLNMKNVSIDGSMVGQILEYENKDLLNFLYLNNQLSIHYDDHIFKDIIFHCVYKEKLQSVQQLLNYWEYDFSNIHSELKIYGKKINDELMIFLERYSNNLKLKNKLESKMINNKNERKKLEKI